MHDHRLEPNLETQAADAHEATPDAVAYVEDMVRRRGYALMYHRVLAKQDLPVLKAADGLVSAAYLEQRALDRKTKELLFVLSLTVLRGDPAHIASHIRVALEVGATATEILEAIEIALPEAGVVAFQHGFDVWREVVDADGVVLDSDQQAT
ncbi:carboxymuconolactone decarboxylase family protein [Nocardioides sp. HM23]|uniref:carboxymuconolactone decarboxylase family protein n=1 Tax=Nocardioides bizhenqiangii TaxID=3095076 RepID=UPI002ACAD8F6|nr:carboxymuconolactone decarboxylase family protein [Nocardioides sp. HM23]MDZ5621060.1 carboxymuconolactone decarboxylase family protein [Nocardioides sp. HM23]